MRKISRFLYVSLFLLSLLIPLCLTETREDMKSELNNRKLAELPEIDDSLFERRLEEYFQDRIGLREQMVTGYQVVNDKVAKELTHPIYTYGKNGYIYFKMHENIKFDSYHETFAQAVVKMKEYCETRGILFYFMFDPEKTSVYRRYLPDGVNYNDNWVDRFLLYLIDNDVKVINNRDVLTELSYNEQVFNRQYDAGHWNDLGCFYGTNNLWKTVHEDYPAVEEYTLNDFLITTKTENYLPMSRFPVNEKVPKFALNAKWNNITEKYTDLDRDKSYRFFQYYVNQSEEANRFPQMLVFHGSYYNRSPQFFIGRAREYIGIHDYQNVLNLDYYVNIFQPEMVIFEVAEYTFENSYFDEKIMINLDYNPYISKEEVERIKQSIINSTNDEAVITKNIYIKPRNGVDEIELGDDLKDAKYVYIIADDKVYDLQRHDGIYSTGICNDGIQNSSAILYYVNSNGKEYKAKCNVKLLIHFSDFIHSISHSNNVSSNKDVYLFETTIRDNLFNAIDIQLWNADKNQYLNTIASTGSTGLWNGSFQAKGESNWYCIRIKANSNLEDEWIDIKTYLEKDEEYSFYCTIDELTEKKVVISNLDLFGSCPNDLRELFFPETEDEHQDKLDNSVGDGDKIEEKGKALWSPVEMLTKCALFYLLLFACVKVPFLHSLFRMRRKKE